MIYLKSIEEIELIRKSGSILSKLHGAISKELKPGVTTLSLDKFAEEYINDNNALPSFKGFHGYPNTLCVSVNEVIVHGLPSNYEIKDCDLVSIDCGVLYGGFHSDSAFTYSIGEITDSDKNLLKVTKEALDLGIDKVQVGVTTGDIGHSIQHHIEKNNLSVIREFVGHGIGRMIHEDPEFPNYGEKQSGPKLRNGMVFALEPMVCSGQRKIKYEKDGWTVRTHDRTRAAHYEHTVALIDGKPEVLTTFDYIESKYLI